MAILHIINIKNSQSALLYDVKLWPRTILHARLWTCSLVLGCFIVRDEFHTTSAYSKRGRMYPLYTVISSSFLKPNLFLTFLTYRDGGWFLEITWEIFLSQERSCGSQTPSIFAWSTKLKGQPLISNSVGWGTSVLKHIYRPDILLDSNSDYYFQSISWMNEELPATGLNQGACGFLLLSGHPHWTLVERQHAVQRI